MKITEITYHQDQFVTEGAAEGSEKTIWVKPSSNHTLIVVKSSSPDIEVGEEYDEGDLNNYANNFGYEIKDQGVTENVDKKALQKELILINKLIKDMKHTCHSWQIKHLLLKKEELLKQLKQDDEFNGDLDSKGRFTKDTVQKMFGKLSPDAKDIKEESCPHCAGPMFSEELMMEKKDACYYKVKSRYKVWPSAYASGALVKCRKKGAKNWGTKSESVEKLDENLHQWFKEKWVRFGPDGKRRGDCARGDDSEGKPKCLPQAKAHSLGKAGRKYAASKKRREDPNPERHGPAKNVATKKKSNESIAEEQLDELKCWPGYSRVQGVPAGAPGSCKKKTNESSEDSVQIKYWQQDTQESGHWAKTKPMSRTKAEQIVNSFPRGEIVDDDQEVSEGENWSKYNHKRVGGMSKKSVSSYRRSHPGSKIQTAVTTKPSKLKKGSKSAARRKSFCARMRGMKKHRTGAKTARDPNSNINKSLRRWHCESVQELQELVMIAEQFIKNNK